MGMLNDDMKRVVRQQRLGFIATVCPDGTPNLSPKGTAAVWDDDHLVFADLASPTTMTNLRHNPALELNVVDAFARKGYRFKGAVSIVEKGEALFDEIRNAFETGSRGIHQVQIEARAYVLLKVDRALPVVSPAYVPGRTEHATREEWAGYWNSVQQSRMTDLESEG
jgi:predicted pyridoxine 5'-phosphate oxidase superfamily flavin-nucleotide-binding protein